MLGIPQPPPKHLPTPKLSQFPFTTYQRYFNQYLVENNNLRRVPTPSLYSVGIANAQQIATGQLAVVYC